jgi:hypothetical protein
MRPTWLFSLNAFIVSGEIPVGARVVWSGMQDRMTVYAATRFPLQDGG